MVSITNDYLLRDLSVSKLVISGDLKEDDATDLKTREFSFTLYKLNGDTYEAVPKAVYTVDGVEYTTGDDGSFTLKNNETAIFDDIGYVDDVYKIVETEDADYPQVYPMDGEAAYVTLADDGGNIQIINGSEGLVSLKKEVTGTDDVGKEVADIIKSDNTTTLFGNAAPSETYSIETTIWVYDKENTLVEDGNYTLIYISQSGTLTSTDFSGKITIDLSPYDSIYLANILEGYTVEAEESIAWDTEVLTLATEVKKTVGANVRMLSFLRKV